MRGLKFALAIAGAVVGGIVGWVWWSATMQPHRINFAFVAGHEPSFVERLGDYLPLVAPVLGALIGWSIAMVLSRALSGTGTLSSDDRDQ